MSLFDNFRNWLLEPLLGQEYVRKLSELELHRAYRKGNHKAPIKSADDAIVVNFIGLQVDRSVANLFGKEPSFDLPGESDSPMQLFIDEVWRVNRKQNLLKQLATYGAEAGTCYVKILPDGAVSKQGAYIPRLVVLDPATVSMDALPEDVETIIRYTIAYAIGDKAIKQVSEHDAETGYWNITDYESINGARWTETNKQEWEYDFAPIVHWQNLSEPGSVYGRPDITADLIDLQDKINFVSSNTAKIIKYHAYPKTWARGFTNQARVQWGVDDMVTTSDPNAVIQNLEMQSDLSSSLAFIRYLRQSMFDIARSVDIDSLADKLGALTNFGLRVLYQDALSKLEEKRGLYGEGIVEINHRLLELAGAPDTDGGEVEWPELLPSNDSEIAQALRTDLELGLVSKQTAAGLRGYSWEDEEERIATEAQAGDNLGAALLRTFGQGG
jgi:hypothetical protein